jgi:dihydrofolate reductase
MSNVVFDISISLDGYITGPNQTDDEPLGAGGERLHEWGMGTERGKELLDEAVEKTGAILVGRRTYDHSIRYWGADGPVGSARLPTVVLTHSAPDDAPENSVYTFATDGVEAAGEQARELAGGKRVGVGGGADTGQQVIRAGLADELLLHVVPVLFGGGTPLFGELDGALNLDPISVEDDAGVAHLRYRIVR